MRQVVEMVREPLRALTATLKRLVKDIGRVVQPIRDAVMRLTRVFAAVCKNNYFHLKYICSKPIEYLLRMG